MILKLFTATVQPIACAALTVSFFVAADVDAQVPAEDIGFQSSMIDKVPNYTGTLFKANYSFPKAPDDMSAQPWMTIDPRKPGEQVAYYDAVLKYGLSAFSGDIAAGCPSVSNAWFHAPWMTVPFGATPKQVANGEIGPGREPICGMTQERPAPVKFLHPSQTRQVQSWAVGVYNQPGGYTMGRVWANHQIPDLTDTKFPNGTFVIKFLFTEADESLVPYLKGAPAWESYVYESVDSTKRARKVMRLLQIDFAVRDSRMDAQTGWVFGTFMYANTAGAVVVDWKTHMRPVGAMWGNDPGKNDIAAYQEQKLTDEIVKLRDGNSLWQQPPRHDFGWKDRVNGPIDNPVSSCLSCHGTAQVHKTINVKQFITPSLKAPATDEGRMLWFRNVKAGETFTFTPEQLKLVDQRNPSVVRADWTPALMADFVSTDYSLQLRMGIESARAYAIQTSISALSDINAQKSLAAVKALTSASSAVHKDFQREFKRIERAGSKP